MQTFKCLCCSYCIDFKHKFTKNKNTFECYQNASQCMKNNQEVEYLRNINKQYHIDDDDIKKKYIFQSDNLPNKIKHACHIHNNHILANQESNDINKSLHNTRDLIENGYDSEINCFIPDYWKHQFDVNDKINTAECNIAKKNDINLSNTTLLESKSNVSRSSINQTPKTKQNLQPQIYNPSKATKHICHTNKLSFEKYSSQFVKNWNRHQKFLRGHLKIKTTRKSKLKMSTNKKFQKLKHTSSCLVDSHYHYLTKALEKNGNILIGSCMSNEKSCQEKIAMSTCLKGLTDHKNQNLKYNHQLVMIASFVYFLIRFLKKRDEIVHIPNFHGSSLEISKKELDAINTLTTMPMNITTNENKYKNICQKLLASKCIDEKINLLETIALSNVSELDLLPKEVLELNESIFFQNIFSKLPCLFKRKETMVSIQSSIQLDESNKKQSNDGRNTSTMVDYIKYLSLQKSNSVGIENAIQYKNRSFIEGSPFMPLNTSENEINEESLALLNIEKTNSQKISKELKKDLDSCFLNNTKDSRISVIPIFKKSTIEPMKNIYSSVQKINNESSMSSSLLSLCQKEIIQSTQYAEPTMPHHTNIFPISNIEDRTSFAIVNKCKDLSEDLVENDFDGDNSNANHNNNVDLQEIECDEKNKNPSPTHKTIPRNEKNYKYMNLNKSKLHSITQELVTISPTHKCQELLALSACIPPPLPPPLHSSPPILFPLHSSSVSRLHSHSTLSLSSSTMVLPSHSICSSPSPPPPPTLPASHKLVGSCWKAPSFLKPQTLVFNGSKLHPPSPPPSPSPPQLPHPQQITIPNSQLESENTKIIPLPPPPPKFNGHLNPNNNIKPKLKQLVWDKITTTPTHKTIWSNATLENVKMDLKELESLFALNEASPKNLTVKDISLKIQKLQAVNILDLKRAHNVSIQLRSLRISLPKLIEALQVIDFNILTSEVLMVMYNTLPNEEDTKLLQSYNGNTISLVDIEKYYLELIKISSYKKRIKSLIFKQQYKTTFEYTQHDLELLNKACDQLKSSQSLVKVLEMVLVVGNHLNGGSFRGAARGFKLNALLKLMDVKGQQKNTTLLHFVVAELLKTNEEIGKLSEEMKEVKLVANLSLDRVHLNLKELEKGVELVNKEIQEMQSTNEIRFLETMTPFAKSSKLEFENLQILANMSFEKLKDVAMYFGEPIKEDRQSDLFKTMREFLFMFDCVCNEIKNSQKSKENSTLKIHIEQRSKSYISSKNNSPLVSTSYCKETSKLLKPQTEKNENLFFHHLGRLESAQERRRPSTSFKFTPPRTNTSSPTNKMGIVTRVREKLLQNIRNQSQCYDSDWPTS